MAAALALAIESLVFVGVHAQYHGVGSIVMVCVLGLLMALVRVRPDGPVTAPVTRRAPAMRVLFPLVHRCFGSKPDWGYKFALRGHALLMALTA